MGDGEEDETPHPHDGDDHDDEQPKGAPPDPLDRNWLHPTELSALTTPERAPAAPAAPSTSRAASLVGMGIAAVVGALVTVAVLAMTGNLGDTAPTVASGAQPGNTASLSAADAAAQLAASIVTVTARDGKGARRGSGVCVWHGGGCFVGEPVVPDHGPGRLVPHLEPQPATPGAHGGENCQDRDHLQRVRQRLP